MNRITLPLVLVGGAVAQQITGIPQLNNVAVIAAVNTNDPEYKICTNANSYLEQCIDSLGGTRALATVAPSALVACACCIDGTAISEAYSTCSSYLSAEEPTLSSEYSAYDTFYTVCGQHRCTGASGSGSGSFRASVTASASAEETKSDDDATITTSVKAATGSIVVPGSITASASLVIPEACNLMVGLYSSCSRKIDGFSDQPFRQQASCYCCNTSGNNVVWTDELDGYAKTCRNWASTAEPDTIYSVASTFATFCDNFGDVCDGAATAPAASSTGSTSNGNGNGGDNGNDQGGNDKETVTVTANPPAQTEQPGAGSVIRAGCAAGLAAVVGAALL